MNTTFLKSQTTTAVKLYSSRADYNMILYCGYIVGLYCIVIIAIKEGGGVLASFDVD